MRDIKFSILLQHDETGRIVDRRFSYADLFNSTAKAEIDKLKRYAVIARREYIGRTDKHGKEIYEGDILQDLFGVRQEVVSFVDPVHLLSGWILKPIRKPDVPRGGYSVTYTSWLQVGEVIGNIYENPELLQREGDPHA